MDFRVWITWSKHLGCCSTFEKLKNTRLSARVFLRFSQVSQHPACLDHVIQTRKPIRYFLKIILILRDMSLLFTSFCSLISAVKEGACRGGSRIFYTLVKILEVWHLGGSGGMPPRKIFKLWVSEMPFPAF